MHKLTPALYRKRDMAFNRHIVEGIAGIILGFLSALIFTLAMTAF